MPLKFSEVENKWVPTGVLAMVPKQLVLQLAMHAEKNGGLGGLQELPPPLELLHQVTVKGVHGVLRRSLDGDFIINHKEFGNCLRTKVEFPYNGEVEFSVDVVCSTCVFKMFLCEPNAFPFCAFMMLPSLLCEPITFPSAHDPCFLMYAISVGLFL